MTPSQLRQWTLQNSQPDQWWLCLDSVTEEIPVAVSEIEERLKSGEFSAGQVLHVSQSGMANPPWIDVTMPAPIKSPIVANAEFLAPGAPLASGAMLNQVAVSQPSSLRETIGIVGLILAVCLLLFSLRNMPYILIFILAWIIASVLILRTKQSCVITFGGGLIAAAITLLLAAKILPDLGSDSGSSAAHHRVEQSEEVSSKKLAFGEHTISGDSVIGFSHLEDEERASELAGDDEALKKFFFAGMMTKRATLFKRGETVILEDAEGLLSSKVKLRRKGETVSYWTNREAID